MNELLDSYFERKEQESSVRIIDLPRTSWNSLKYNISKKSNIYLKRKIDYIWYTNDWT